MTFFTFKNYLFDGYLQLESMKSNILSAVAAIVALHLALGLYIYRAYSDSQDKKQLQQKLE